MERSKGQGVQSAPSWLSRERILDVAMKILVERGAEQLTVRGLAAELGVAGTSVYWHVGNKQALLDALVDRVIEDLGEVRARGRTPTARIRSVAAQVRRSQLSCPDLVAFVHQQGRIAGLFRPARRELARELIAAGIEGREAVLGVEAIIFLVIGSVLFDVQLGRQPTQTEVPAELWKDSDLPDAPEALAYFMRPVDYDTVFSYSLDTLIHSILGS
jgi:AcrR family transcriptional regulator